MSYFVIINSQHYQLPDKSQDPGKKEKNPSSSRVILNFLMKANEGEGHYYEVECYAETVGGERIRRLVMNAKGSGVLVTMFSDWMRGRLRGCIMHPPCAGTGEKKSGSLYKWWNTSGIASRAAGSVFHFSLGSVLDSESWGVRWGVQSGLLESWSF